MKYGNCFYCGKEINVTDSKRMVPLEKPYMNLFFHLDCLNEIPDINLYLTENQNLLQEYSRSKYKKSCKNNSDQDIML